MLNRWMMVTAAALVCVSGATAQEAAAPTLKVGDKAPKLSIENWVKGKPIEKFESGKVYVVEFWATWCGPCIKGIPHLTELQKDYKDKKVTVIGVASSENGGNAESKLSGVKNFVQKQGDKMEYTVAFDADRSMSKDWMTAAAQRGIPCAFLVGSDGKIAWIGHPMNGLDEQLKKAAGASKRVGSKNSDGSTQVASNSDGNSNSDSQTSSQTSSSSQSSSSSDSKKSSDSSRSSDSKKKSSSDSKRTSDSQKSSDPK